MYFCKSGKPLTNLEHYATSLPDDNGVVMLFPMYTVAMELVLQMTEVQPHEHLKARGDLTVFEESETKRAALVSHQWVSKRHPDPEFRQMSVLQEALKQLLVSKSVPLDIATESGVPGAKPLPLHEFQSASVFLWYDYFSIPQMEDRSTFGADQSDGSKQADAINSIPAYVAKCKYFMALCPVIDCSEEDKVLSCATWGSHLLDRVLALGLQASAVVGPFTRGGSKDPGWGRSAAIGM
eukprot:s4260_g7.t1